MIAGWLDCWIAGKDVGCFAVWPSSHLAVQQGVKKKKIFYAARCAILPFAERMILPGVPGRYSREAILLFLSTNLHGFTRIGDWFAQLCCSKQSPVLLMGNRVSKRGILCFCESLRTGVLFIYFIYMFVADFVLDV